MNAEEMWRLSGIQGEYDSWAFGDDPDKLAELVQSGRKTRTSSAYPIYEIEGEPLPKAGQYSVILDSQENPVCIIQTTKVFVIPFDEVTSEHAKQEGEEDLSLEYWRSVHRAFFTEEMRSVNLGFDEKMLVVCEEFSKVFSPN